MDISEIHRNIYDSKWKWYYLIDPNDELLAAVSREELKKGPFP